MRCEDFDYTNFATMDASSALPLGPTDRYWEYICL